MADFQNKKNHDNNERGLVVGLSITGVLYAVIHVTHVIQGLNESQEETKFKDAHSYIIITDSTTGRKDTLLLSDYLQKEKPAADTTVKTGVIFPK